MQSNSNKCSFSKHLSIGQRLSVLPVAAVTLALACPAAWGASPHMAVSQGMGNTVRANPHCGGAIYTSPGMVWVDGRFDVSGGVRFGSDGAFDLQVAGHDSQTSPVGLGVQWFRRTQDLTPDPADLPGWRRKGTSFTNEVKHSVLAATLGGGGVHHLFGVGLSVRYFNSASTLLGASHSFNVAPGVSGLLGDQLYLSLTAENAIPLGYEGAPMGVGTGARWQPSDRFGLAFDTVTDFSSFEESVAFSPMVGMEVVAADLVPFRIGWSQDGVSGTRLWTGGVGASNESFGLNYGVQLDLEQEDGIGHWHSVSLRISM